MLLTQEEKKIDPRVKRTRQALQHALMELMTEKSFPAITVQDIAERADVNRVTFYAHFQDKQALLEHALREVFREHLHSQLPEDAPFTPDNLQLLIQTVCEFLAQFSGHCPPPHNQFEPLMEKKIKEELTEVLERWVTQVPHRNTRLAPELAATVNSAALYAAAVRWKEEGQSQPAGKFARQVLPWFLASLQATGK